MPFSATVPPLPDAFPASLRGRLETLRAELTRALGEDLVALMLFGSVARGEYRDGVSDVDLIVVLRRATPEALATLSNPLTLARYASRIEAIVLEADEIPRAADVFPLFYDDIKRCHVLLAGVDPFASLTIADHHRRIRIEQELREASIRLRRAVIDAQGSLPQIAGVVDRKVKQLRGPLHALLSLRGTPCEPRLPDVLAAAAAAWGIDLAPLSHPREAPREAHGALVRLLATAIDEVDRMDSP